MLGIDLAHAYDWDNLCLETRRRYIDDILTQKKYIYLGTGRHRMTWMAPHERFVLKFPTCSYGISANNIEAHLWKNRRSYDVQFSPCRLILDSILMMQTVVELHGYTNACQRAASILNRIELPPLPKPSWAYYIESNQVGRLRNGKWVAYDYADY